MAHFLFVRDEDVKIDACASYKPPYKRKHITVPT